MARTSNDILRDVEKNQLAVAEQGLQDLINGVGPRRVHGLLNLVTFGRQVTFGIQNLRTTEGEEIFDEWYLPLQAKMRADPLMHFFVEKRNEIEKQARLEIDVRGTVNVNSAEILRAAGSPPPGPGEKSIFVGNPHNGGMGWEVELPDGTIENYYVELPSSVGEIDLYFKDPPTSHLGKPLRDTSAKHLARLYLRHLRQLLIEARKRFVEV